MQTPRFNTRKTDGTVCCVGEYGCPSCREKEAEMKANSYAAPSSYGRAAQHITVEYDAHGVPSSYGLAALRRKREGR